jgi:1-acyl-sn-glycerol-3-phosphate acyltransferase
LLLTALGRRWLIPPPFLRGVGWLAGLRVRRDGRPAPGARLLMVANHTSWLDILALAGASRSAFVAKGELAGHGFLKWLCEQNDTLFITRERRGSVTGQVSQLGQALAHRRMTIFPEGTTSDGTALLPFKSALLSAVEGAQGEVTVQPVALHYEDAPAIAWHGAEEGGANVLRILARTRPIRLTARFLPPLAGSELADRKTMAAAAERRIGEALALPRALPKSPPIA